MSVHHLKGVISRADIDRALDVLSTLKWTKGRTHNQEYGEKVKCNEELRASDDIRLKVILEDFQKKIWRNTEFSTKSFAYKAAALRFNKCSDGGFYGPHADASIMNVPPIRSDLSMTLFLSEGYEGGELIIDGVGSFKGEPGDIVLYPSYYVHQVTPVTAGQRICAVMWIQSMIREESKRDLLTRFYNLGVRMKEIDGLGPDYTETTSIYNNLLRMWAEV